MDGSNSYELLHFLEKRNYCDVYVGRSLITGKLATIRIIDLEYYPIEIAKLFKRVALWSTTRHQSLVQYVGSYVKGSRVWIISEYLDGGNCADVLKYLYPNGIKDESIIAAILKPIVKLIAYLHNHNHVHLDICSKNIIFSSDGLSKMSDSGISCTECLSSVNHIIPRSFSAPDNLHNDILLLKKKDIFDIGNTALELFSGHLQSQNSMIEIPNGISKHYKNFMGICMNNDPYQRYSAKKLLSHPFLKSSCDKRLIHTLLTTNRIPYTVFSDSSAPVLSKSSSGHNIGVSFDFGDENKSQCMKQHVEIVCGPVKQMGRFQVITKEIRQKM